MTAAVIAIPAAHAAAPVRGRAPFSAAAMVGLVVVAKLCAVMVLVASLIGPFVMFAIPFMLLFGFALGPLHALVRGDLR